MDNVYMLVESIHVFIPVVALAVFFAVLYMNYRNSDDSIENEGQTTKHKKKSKIEEKDDEKEEKSKKSD